MPVIKIVVEHTIEQVVMLDIPADELEELTYEDAVCNCPFDDFQPSTIDTEIINATINGKEHYFK